MTCCKAGSLLEIPADPGGGLTAQYRRRCKFPDAGVIAPDRQRPEISRIENTPRTLEDIEALLLEPVGNVDEHPVLSQFVTVPAVHVHDT